MADRKRSAVVLAALLLSVASLPAIATAGDGVVGTATLDLQDKATGRKVTTELWFAAAPGAKVESFAVRPPLRAIAIARDAEPRPTLGKRPLVVISHGNWGTRFSQGWLALDLVRAGYVVLSTTHPGTAADDQSVAGRHRLWDRSRDVTFALDEVLSDSRWAPLIDQTRVGFVGHSFGGWTGFSLAGGRYDPVLQRAFCADQPRKDFYCDNMLKDDIRSVPLGDGGESFKDDRIKAFYVMASGPGRGFAVDSLKAITSPFMVDTAKFDDVLEPMSNSIDLARRIPGAREVVRPVGHFTYVPECRWLIGPILAKRLGFPVCDDPGGVDRARFHRQIATDAVAFFNETLARKD